MKVKLYDTKRRMLIAALRLTPEYIAKQGMKYLPFQVLPAYKIGIRAKLEMVDEGLAAWVPYLTPEQREAKLVEIDERVAQAKRWLDAPDHRGSDLEWRRALDELRWADEARAKMNEKRVVLTQAGLDLAEAIRFDKYGKGEAHAS